MSLSWLMLVQWILKEFLMISCSQGSFTQHFRWVDDRKCVLPNWAPSSVAPAQHSPGCCSCPLWWLASTVNLVWFGINWNHTSGCVCEAVFRRKCLRWSTDRRRCCAMGWAEQASWVPAFASLFPPSICVLTILLHENEPLRGPAMTHSQSACLVASEVKLTGLTMPDKHPIYQWAASQP